MEDDILDSLQDLGCVEQCADETALKNAVDLGPKSLEFTRLVEWLSKELKILCKLEDDVNAITDVEDSSSFLLEVSSFLKELNCPHASLMEGPISQRLLSRESRLLLLDFLCSELQAARMIAVNSPETSTMKLEVFESQTAKDLKAMLIALEFLKPPPNITPTQLFSKVKTKVSELIQMRPPASLGKPLLVATLSDKQWFALEKLQNEMNREYRMRREMLLKRLDVTIQSFQWSGSAKSKANDIAKEYVARRQAMSVEPNVTLSDILAAREDLTIIEKTSSASVRTNTQCAVNKILIGRVPDRGGRPSEQQRPPPEMPSWQKRTDGGGGGGRGDRGGRGGRGGDRGGRVQGNWSGGRGGGHGRGGGRGHASGDALGGYGQHGGYSQQSQGFFTQGYDASGAYGGQQQHYYYT